ncbi:MAG: M20/M25/M40 family metallo-hydrolase [Acidobacteria bacterium]|nr:M20/M25/M40 family metallo-hydrolase [Acidobacteriota bacterium]MBE3129567.1 M20/M25/M40 family metallo-hydrolase [Acidobacteriota bacterium]
MKPFPRALAAVILLVAISAFASDQTPTVDWDTVAKIREEGLQRSEVMDIVGYMTDVLGARLTLSEDMKRAQAWAKDKMEKLGLTNVVVEPFMDYGAAWDNEYFSLHMLEPDYQPMVGFPLAHTAGTKGKVVCPAVIASDIQTKKDLDRYRGKLKGAAVLITPPFTLDMAALTQGVARRTPEEMKQMEEAVVPTPQRPATPPPPLNPDLLKPEEKLEFFRAEGAAVVLQCESGMPGAVRGFARPGTKDDKWSREKTLGTLPIVAVTPEHYNRMYRILKRNIPVKIEAEVRNRVGEKVEKAANVVGEFPGTDLADEVVMVGAHFDSWHASPGASDDAAGCAVALEAVRILKAIGVKPRRTIRLAFWGGEEQGLHGSREYVNAHFGNPKDPKAGIKPEYEKFSSYFNQDYGAGQFRGIYLQGNERVRRLFAAWMEPFRDFGLTTISIQSVGSTDHVSFDAAGLPGFQFIQDRIGGTAGHTNMDFFDTLRAEDLMKNAVVEAAFVYHAAMADQRIPRKQLK